MMSFSSIKFVIIAAGDNLWVLDSALHDYSRGRATLILFLDQRIEHALFLATKSLALFPPHIRHHFLDFIVLILTLTFSDSHLERILCTHVQINNCGRRSLLL